ncbi:uncharacterized protein LOC135400631 [Ornithodoros turicata]|uniref:uncharacterized protein LOC135400631 n=1 Tax=Ornithodoros turicata TaxID=34597 RepID=UPI003138AA9F
MGLLEPENAMYSETGKKEYVQSVKVSGSDHFLLTVLDCDQSTYELTLTNGTDCFQGTVRPDDIALRAELGRCTVSELKSLTHKALTSYNENGEEFAYSLTTREDGTTRLLAWKQRLAEGAARVVGEAVLRRRDYLDGIIQILTATMRIIKHREACLENSRSELERLRAENREALTLLDKSTHMKDQMEQELYSKFVSVLNAKKRRIAQLEEGGGGDDDARTKCSRTTTSADEASTSSKTSQVRSTMDILDDLI